MTRYAWMDVDRARFACIAAESRPTRAHRRTLPTPAPSLSLTDAPASNLRDMQLRGQTARSTAAKTARSPAGSSNGGSRPSTVPLALCAAALLGLVFGLYMLHAYLQLLATTATLEPGGGRPSFASVHGGGSGALSSREKLLATIRGNLKQQGAAGVAGDANAQQQQQQPPQPPLPDRAEEEAAKRAQEAAEKDAQARKQAAADAAQRQQQQEQQQQKPPAPVPLATPIVSAFAPPTTHPIPILIFTFNRANNLRETIVSVLKERPEPFDRYPVYISHDGYDDATRATALMFSRNEAQNPRWSHVFYMNFQGAVETEPQMQSYFTYYKIAHHYRWAISQVMDSPLAGAISPPPPPALATQPYKHLILLEDDMRVAPDFFEYFRRMHVVLDEDPTLLCASAWNDNGRPTLVHSPRQLYRSECFPGLGWLLTRRVWEELSPKWPKGFWDDWLREPPQRLGRSCIFPEINRVYTFGEKGSSGGQFYDQYLKSIVLNDVKVDWATEELGYIASKANYRRWLHSHISTARVVGVQEDVNYLLGAIDPADEVVLENGAKRQFVLPYGQLDRLLIAHGMMTDHKAGIPRTSFEGVLSFTTGRDHRVWIVPEASPFLKKEWIEGA